MKMKMKMKMKPLLRFLEFGCFSSSTTTRSTADTDINITTEKLAVNNRGIKLKHPIKKPPKPTVKSGRGGQIHANLL
ncbi:hypothetical protein SOVF_064040 [Spinacia oleracea]|nr:hypothetical protein SOVF_064040 [Spinacia oleracea]